MPMRIIRGSGLVIVSVSNQNSDPPNYGREAFYPKSAQIVFLGCSFNKPSLRIQSYLPLALRIQSDSTRTNPTPQLPRYFLTKPELPSTNRFGRLRLSLGSAYTLILRTRPSLNRSTRVKLRNS